MLFRSPRTFFQEERGGESFSRHRPRPADDRGGRQNADDRQSELDGRPAFEDRRLGERRQEERRTSSWDNPFQVKDVRSKIRSTEDKTPRNELPVDAGVYPDNAIYSRPTAVTRSSVRSGPAMDLQDLGSDQDDNGGGRKINKTGGGLWDYARRPETIMSKMQRQRRERSLTNRSIHGADSIKLQAMKLDTFTGETKWEEYIPHLEGTCAWNLWSDEEAAHALRIALRGDAATYITSLFGYDQMNLDTLVSNLQRRFGRPKNRMADKRRLRERMMKPTETVEQYGQELRRMADVAFDDPITAEREALEVFALGMPTYVRDAISTANPKTFNECLELASRVMSLRGGTNYHPYRSQRTVAAVQAERESENCEIIDLAEDRKDEGEEDEVVDVNYNSTSNKYGDGYKKTGNRYNNSDKKKEPPVCFNCGEKNHYIKDCPYPLKKNFVGTKTTKLPVKPDVEAKVHLAVTQELEPEDSENEEGVSE